MRLGQVSTVHFRLRSHFQQVNVQQEEPYLLTHYVQFIVFSSQYNLYVTTFVCVLTILCVSQCFL